MIEKKPEGEKLCLFQVMRSTGGFGVVWRVAQRFHLVGESGSSGYIGYWLIWVKNTDNISSLWHDLIVCRVYAGFAQGSHRVWAGFGFSTFSLINCCRVQGRSREILPEGLQNNWRPPTLKIRALTTGWVYILTIFRFHFGLSRTVSAVYAPAVCTPDPSHTEKVLRFCTKSHDFVPKFAEKTSQRDP